MKNAFNDYHPEVQRFAIRALEVHGETNYLVRLLPAFAAHPSYIVRGDAVSMLGRIGDEQSGRKLEEVLRNVARVKTREEYYRGAYDKNNISMS
jgi:HEAT repeat protein